VHEVKQVVESAARIGRRPTVKLGRRLHYPSGRIKGRPRWSVAIQRRVLRLLTPRSRCRPSPCAGLSPTPNARRPRWAVGTGPPPDLPDIDGVALRAIPLSEDAFDNYYEGFANSTIWSPYHDAVEQPRPGPIGRRWTRPSRPRWTPAAGAGPGQFPCSLLLARRRRSPTLPSSLAASTPQSFPAASRSPLHDSQKLPTVRSALLVAACRCVLSIDGSGGLLGGS